MLGRCAGALPPRVGFFAIALLQRHHLGRLVARQYLGAHIGGVQPQALRHGQGSAPVVPRNHHGANAARAQRRQRLARPGLGLVAKGQNCTQGQPVGGALGQGRHRGAIVLQAFRPRRQRAQPNAQLVHPAQAAHQVAAGLHLALGAAPRHGAHAVGRHGLQAALLRSHHHCTGQRVLAATLHTGHGRQHGRLVLAGHHLKGSEPWAAHGQGAGLVKRHHIHLVGQLQRLRVLDQNAIFCRHPRARHDGRRRGQPQCAGAGNHQHGHGTDHGQLKARTHPQPAQQRGQRHQQHHRHKDGRHLVNHALQGRLGGLRILDQSDDARQHRLGAHRRHLHHHPAIAIDGAAGQGRTHLARHGQGLAGQHGLVYLGVALQNAAVHRNALARAHHQPVARHHLGHRHIHLAVTPQHVGHIRPQRVQCADGRCGLPLGAGLQPLAQQHQRHHHRRGVEIQVRGMPLVRREPQPHRQPPARRGANRHQQIHVARQRLERVPARLVKTRPQNELHRRGQRKLRPGRQHPVRAKQIAQHGQHQRGRQQQAHAHRQKTGPGRQVLGRIVLPRRARLVARIAHGAAQQGIHGRALGIRGHHISDARGLGGQVHGGILHAGHLAQRPLHAAHATGAGHAANAKVQGFQGVQRFGESGNSVHGGYRNPCHDGKVKPWHTSTMRVSVPLWALDYATMSMFTMCLSSTI